MMLGAGKDYKGFFGLFAHEASHNWYYGMLGNNEQLYHWLDEGFTSYAEEEAMNYVFNSGFVNPHLGSLGDYLTQVYSGLNEPMTTPSDYFETHRHYVVSAYRMGELFLMQLEYILGQETFKKGMLTYYNRWLFKHPKPGDIIKAMEDVSGMQLDWFLIYWTQLTKLTDYAVLEVTPSAQGTMEIKLSNNGTRPMPVDVVVTFKNGSQRFYTIPLVSMYGAKGDGIHQPLQPWPWTSKEYSFTIAAKPGEIDSIVLDPEQKSCDVFSINNEWVAQKN